MKNFKSLIFTLRNSLCYGHYQNWDRLSSTSHGPLLWYGNARNLRALPYMEQPLMMKMAV